MARHLHFDCFSGIGSDDARHWARWSMRGLPFKDLVRGLASLKIDRLSADA